MSEGCPVAELLPHDGNMVLLDELIDCRDSGATARLTVRADSLFDNNGSVPAWLGIEYMAQTIGAWAGSQAKRMGKPVQLGFLLGTRRYNSNCARIACGTELSVNVEEVLQSDNGLSVFACEVQGEGVLITANVNVFQPEEVDKFLSEGQI